MEVLCMVANVSGYLGARHATSGSARGITLLKHGRLRARQFPMAFMIHIYIVLRFAVDFDVPGRYEHILGGDNRRNLEASARY